MLFRNIEGGIFVKLFSRKMTSDKRVVTDFIHLNMRIVKIN